MMVLAMISKKRKISLLTLAALFAFSPVMFAFAQEQAGGLTASGSMEQLDAATVEGSLSSKVTPADSTDPRFSREALAFFDQNIPDPRTMDSLFFSPWTRALIREYRLNRGDDRPSIDPNPMPGSDGGVSANPDRGIREITLGGIAYAGYNQWTIWFNGQRVTPKALPEQLHDLKVTKDYIDIKWFDPYTNIIFPIRLRPHQRFNLDTRIFLPG